MANNRQCGTRKQDPRYGNWSGTRKSMTYGVFPSRRDFFQAFKEEVTDGSYDIRNDTIVGTASFDAEGLHDLLIELTRDFGDDEAMSLASDILGSLGFEWV